MERVEEYLGSRLSGRLDTSSMSRSLSSSFFSSFVAEVVNLELLGSRSWARPPWTYWQFRVAFAQLRLYNQTRNLVRLLFIGQAAPKP